MLKKLLATVLLPFALTVTLSADEIVKDNFEAQADGQNLSDLTNWKFFAGWIKPDDGKIVAEKGNKFLRLTGTIYAHSPSSLTDKLTYRFKIRATGSDDELGGLTLSAMKAKERYDILFNYRGQGAVNLAKDTEGKRETLEKVEAVVKKEVFQDVVVVVEHVNDGVKFTVSVDGTKVLEKVDSAEFSFLKETFNAGFFTFNQKTVDLDDVVFTQGK